MGLTNVYFSNLDHGSGFLVCSSNFGGDRIRNNKVDTKIEVRGQGERRKFLRDPEVIILSIILFIDVYR